MIGQFWSSFKAVVYEIYPPLWDHIAAFLGKYAFEVMTAYFVSIALIVTMVITSLRRSKRVRAQLADVEVRLDRKNV